MRSDLICGLAVAAGCLAAACGPRVVDPGFCFNLDGHCTRTSGNPPEGSPPDSLILFPLDKIDFSTLHDGAVSGRLVAGDSARLYLVRIALFVGIVDTVRTVRWAVTNADAGAIDDRAGGAGMLVARIPGDLRVSANAVTRMVACPQLPPCYSVESIHVVAAPAP